MVQWQLQEAKNRFSEVVQRAKREGPQTITLRGERAAVILSSADYDRLTQGRPSLVDDLLAGPSFDDDLVRVIARRAERPSRDVLLRCISSIRISSPKPGAAQRRPCHGFAPSTRLAFFSVLSRLVR
jgi:prevent-host-death family protein